LIRIKAKAKKSLTEAREDTERRKRGEREEKERGGPSDFLNDGFAGHRGCRPKCVTWDDIKIVPHIFDIRASL